MAQEERDESINLISEELIPAAIRIQLELKNGLNKSEKYRSTYILVKTLATLLVCLGTAEILVGLRQNPLAGGISSFVGVGLSYFFSVVSSYVTKDERNKRKLDIVTFLESQSNYEAVKLRCLDSLTNDAKRLLQRFNRIGKRLQMDYILEWMKLKQFVDERVAIENLQAGDHIYQLSSWSSMISKLNHHGIFIGQDETGVSLVVDFGSVSFKEPVTRPLQEFFRPWALYRRDYKGHSVPAQETVELAKSIVTHRNWEYYWPTSNNCEHFATFLKLKRKWCGQIQSSEEGLATISNQAQIAVYVVFAVTFKCVAVSKGFFDRLCFWREPEYEYEFSILCMVLSPVIIIIQALQLIRDYKVYKPNISAVKAYLKVVENDLIAYRSVLNHLRREDGNG